MNETELAAECLRLALVAYPRAQSHVLHKSLGALRGGDPEIFNVGRYFLFCHEPGETDGGAKFAANDLKTLRGDIEFSIARRQSEITP
jgi:hypothetical protein